MASLKTLQNRLHSIVAEADDKRERFPKAAVNAWLHDFVLEMDELCRLPSFQTYAKWPLNKLVKGCKTPERRLIRKIASDFRRFGARLHRKFTKLTNDYDVPVHLLPADTTKLIAERFWKDLANPADYFRPQRGFTLTKLPSVEKRIMAGMNVFANPFLRPIGDYISRTLKVRIELIKELLKEEVRNAREAIGIAPRGWASILMTYQSEIEDIEIDCNTLLAMCFMGEEYALRNACIAVTQTYFEFHQKPRTGWLSVPGYFPRRGGILGQLLVDRPEFGTLDELCDAVNIVTDHFGGTSGRHTEYERKIETIPLVVREDPPMLYWGGNRINIAWETKRLRWKFMWELAMAATSGRSISERDIYGDDEVGDTTFSQLKHRVAKLLNRSTLQEKIVSGSEPDTYRLDLSPSEIFIIR
ncbi:MAG TPA: hypothetical protein PLN21_16655 [Gemmatales bacterium]|nr:hypothetical protein [Gemmatales bacterium]